MYQRNRHFRESLGHFGKLFPETEIESNKNRTSPYCPDKYKDGTCTLLAADFSVAMEVQSGEFRQRVKDSRKLFDAYVKFLRRETCLFHNEFEDHLASSWGCLLRTFDPPHGLAKEDEIAGVRRATAEYKRAQECFQEYNESAGMAFDTEPLHAQRFRERSKLVQELLHAADSERASQRRERAALRTEERAPARTPSEATPMITEKKPRNRIPRKMQFRASTRETTPAGSRSGGNSADARGPTPTSGLEKSLPGSRRVAGSPTPIPLSRPQPSEAETSAAGKQIKKRKEPAIVISDDEETPPVRRRSTLSAGSQIPAASSDRESVAVSGSDFSLFAKFKQELEYYVERLEAAGPASYADAEESLLTASGNITRAWQNLRGRRQVQPVEAQAFIRRASVNVQKSRSFLAEFQRTATSSSSSMSSDGSERMRAFSALTVSVQLLIDALTVYSAKVGSNPSVRFGGSPSLQRSNLGDALEDRFCLMCL